MNGFNRKPAHAVPNWHKALLVKTLLKTPGKRKRRTGLCFVRKRGGTEQKTERHSTFSGAF